MRICRVLGRGKSKTTLRFHAKHRYIFLQLSTVLLMHSLSNAPAF